MDTVGVVGNLLIDQLDKIGLGQLVTTALISAIGAIVYRFIQMGLQKLPTKWQWVGNNFVVKGIMNKLVGKLFGKTTLLYNMKVEGNEKDKVEARKKAIEHLSRKGGELKAFEEAMKKLQE